MRSFETVAGVTAAVVVALALGSVVATASAGRSADRAAVRPEVREIQLTAKRYEFTPNVIEVNQGDHVRIVARSADGTHGFSIKDLKVRHTIPKGGEAETIEFDATQAGTFEIACSEYCGLGHRRMKATLIVRPAASKD